MTTSSHAWRVFLRRMHSMSFADVFHKSNSSFSPLRGKTVECTVRPLQGNMVSVDTGLKAPIVCFQDELRTRVTEKTKLPFGIDRVEFFGEPRMILPKDLERRNSVKQVWTQLEKIWRSDKNIVKGFVMNRVNGGYAVGIAGYIAFVPRSMLGSKRIFPQNPWRMFSILNMNPKIGNIVVKEAPRLGFRPRSWLPTWNDSRPRSRGSSLAAPGFKQTSLPSWNDGKLKSRGSDLPVAGSASSKWKDQTRLPFRRPQQAGKARPGVLAGRSSTDSGSSISEYFSQ